MSYWVVKASHYPSTAKCCRHTYAELAVQEEKLLVLHYEPALAREKELRDRSLGVFV